VSTGTRVIDINTIFGLRLDPDPRYTSETLAMELDRHHVACALTCSRQGVDYSPGCGNRETIAAARRHPGLVAVGTLNPHDMFGWQAEADRCFADGINVFRFFPRTQRWEPGSEAFREILEYLHRHHAVIIVGISELGGEWNTVDAVARATHPLGIPVVLAEIYYANQAEVIALMRKHAHLYADTSFLATVDAVQCMAGSVGHERLLYGSASPWHPMQKALNQVLDADLPAIQKAAILGGNAERLLKLDPVMLKGRPVLDSLDPVGFEERIIDVHSHLGLWMTGLCQENYDPSCMLARMRKAGISHSILSSYEGMRYDIASGNRALADSIEGHPELLGMVELDPRQYELSCAEMERYYRLPNFSACELELSHLDCPTGSAEVRRLMAVIARHGKPVLLMTQQGDADAAAEIALANANPSLTIVHAHGADPAWARAVKGTPNICVEYCFSRTTHHRVREGIDILGPERVLFGSDQTLLSPAGQIGLYHDARLDARERELILHANARRIYRIK
jgi:predicted TIM-barrel fold metal-dependent hydrolase